MSLITQRPKHWNSVVGQDRALKLLRAVLRSDKFLLRGFIFEGVRGVGKTTTAYLAARALMCTGQDPEGCDRCPSCKTINEQGIDAHPDFMEVDGARVSGVDAARDIVTTAESLPVLGRRRIVMIDEAHAISNDAWKTYLKPLEKPNTDAIFMFVSNQGHKIPDEIRGRCCRPKFSRVNVDVILGYLANLATANQIQYELDALRMISKASKGIVREAAGMLDMCAAMGTVTRELVETAIDTDLEDLCLKIFASIASRDQQGAVKIADEICLTESPVRLIETLFATYAKCVYKPENADQLAVKQQLPEVASVTAIFLKWATPQQLPADAIPLLIIELMGVGEVKMQKWTGYASAPTVQDFNPNVAGPSEFAELTGAKPKR